MTADRGRLILSGMTCRSEKTMNLRLAGELMDAAGNRGVAIKKKEDTHPVDGHQTMQK